MSAPPLFSAARSGPPCPPRLHSRLSRVTGGWLPALLAVVLAGCGGGEDYVPSTTTGSTTTTTDATPVVVNAQSQATMRQGDTWIYEWNNRTAGTGYTSTHHIAALNKTSQLYSIDVLYSDDQPRELQAYSEANVLNRVERDNTLCTYSDLTRPVVPLRSEWVVGKVWSQVWTENCLRGTLATTVKKTVTGTVVAVSEPLSTGLLGRSGTSAIQQFSTVKYTATRTETVPTEGTWTYQDTCWHDMLQNRTVQCNVSASYLPVGATTPTRVEEREQRLIFVREVRTASPVLVTDGPSTMLAYAGRWNFSLPGINIVCPTMKVSLTGTVEGTCIRTVAAAEGPAVQLPFAVKGTVARGTYTSGTTSRTADVFSVITEPNIDIFSMKGEMLNPATAEGTWTVQSNIGGTWTARRL